MRLADELQKDIAEQIKNNDRAHDIPVILMTGYTRRHKPLEVAADDVIEKPFNLSLPENEIGKLIS